MGRLFIHRLKQIHSIPQLLIQPDFTAPQARILADGLDLLSAPLPAADRMNGLSLLDREFFPQIPHHQVTLGDVEAAITTTGFIIHALESPVAAAENFLSGNRVDVFQAVEDEFAVLALLVVVRAIDDGSVVTAIYSDDE